MAHPMKKDVSVAPMISHGAFKAPTPKPAPDIKEPQCHKAIPIAPSIFYLNYFNQILMHSQATQSNIFSDLLAQTQKIKT